MRLNGTNNILIMERIELAPDSEVLFVISDTCDDSENLSSYN